MNLIWKRHILDKFPFDDIVRLCTQLTITKVFITLYL